MNPDLEKELSRILEGSEDRSQIEAAASAQDWQNRAFASVQDFEKFGPDYDGAIPPYVAAEIARDTLREAGLPGLAEYVVTPQVNYYQQTI